MKKKLLLADDSVTIQKVIGIIFTTEDYELLMADNGDEAFDKALAELPDLIISDIQMPGRDGFALCQAIKSEPRLQNTAVLLLPGSFESFDEAHAEEVGADGWITKPFESQALLDKVAQLLESEPVRLGGAGSVAAPEPVQEEPPAAVEEPEAEFEPVLEQPAADDEGGLSEELPAASVDEEILGLDQVDQPGSAEEQPEGEEGSEDIWDAVSFEEEDLQQEEDLGAAAADYLKELGATDDQEDESVELVEEPLAFADEPVDLSSGDQEDDFSFAGDDELQEQVPEVEPLNEETLEGDEEILDLAEEDILEEQYEETIAEQPLEDVEEPAAVYEAPPAPVEEPVPVEAVDVVAPEPVSDVAAAEQQLRALSEDELQAVVARVAGPTIEKLAGEMLEQIVWEVVPDLAESMIREEIRKIRQGAQ